MAQKAIREYDGKRMMAKFLPELVKGGTPYKGEVAQATPETDYNKLAKEHPWLLKKKLVVKPDQLIKRRGKNKLILVNAGYPEAQKWIREKTKGPITIYGKFDKSGKPVDEGTVGRLTHFIIEPMVPHKDDEEMYVAIVTKKDSDEILFYHEGGVNVGDIDAKAARFDIPIGEFPTADKLEKQLCKGVKDAKKRKSAAEFIEGLYKLFADLNFAYLEINPVVVTKDGVVPLDLAAKLDNTAEFMSGKKWGGIEFPSPFGRNLSKEEEYIEGLDAKTGASLKLTVINPEGRVWTMVAGGGASVIFADTITDLGFMDEMANYGEYSGDPNEEFTYLYAKTILDLMTRKKHPKGKFLLIGGGIANFTDVAKTFKGIVKALTEYKEKLKANNVKIFVRRGGPNYREGLDRMKKLGETLGVPIEVYGPETHMTRIVSLALAGKGGKKGGN